MENKVKVCMMGLGYIGLPTAALLASRDYQVYGVDISQHTIDTINQGKIHIVEPELDVFVQSSVQSGSLVASIEPVEADVFIIAVPTPFHADKRNKITNSPIPNVDYIVDAVKSIAPYIKPGNLILLESTSPVGTTDMIARLLSEEGVDIDNIFIAHSPERVLPVVGGINKKSTKKAAEFYRTFVTGEVLETTAKTAEMTKLTENSFRDVNIAFANELSLICDKHKINVWELIQLANKHPRVDILQPGPGVGGHCIAVDPWFIVDLDPDQSKIIATARNINDNKPAWVVKKAISSIYSNNIKDPVISCLGLSFKADIDDTRESPSINIVLKLLQESVKEVVIMEPNIESLPPRLVEYNNITHSTDLNKDLERSDVILILVDHKEFKEINWKEYSGKIILNFVQNNLHIQ
jgi:UDP-N-acetyl-D-mannosaminuronic acid dehydrogenase